MNEELEILKRKLQRERSARKKAEEILEFKSLELYSANKKLVDFNDALELKIKNQVQLISNKDIRFKTLLDSIGDAIFNIDSEGYLTYVNTYAQTLSGYEKETLIGMHFSKLIAPSHRNGVVEYFGNIMENKRDKTYFEFQIISKSGELRWVGQKLTFLELDGKEYINAVARDITETKKTQRQLHVAKAVIEKSEHKYRNIIENMELGLLEVDTDGRVIKAYPIFCKMFGYSESELLGKKAELQFLDEENLAKFYAHQKLRKKGESSVFELEMTKKNGEKAFVLLSGAPFYNSDNKVVGSIGIHYDISDRKQLEEELKTSKNIAERAQEAQKQFLANMSHEMRTPLNAIIGMTHLLGDTDLNNEQQELHKILSSSSGLLLSLISDILDFSKIEAGIVEIQDKPFAIARLLDELHNTFATKFKEKDIDINLNVADDIFPYLIGDELLINQVLINLINNACKFTKSGEVSINISVEHDDPKYQLIQFAVTDTGIGIDKEMLESIFHDFVQEDVTIKENYGGTGLGLAISKKLINVMGSEIQAASKKGKGSTFYFNLSLYKEHNYQKESIAPTQISMDELSAKIKVLIVEDNKMNINYICRLMNKWNLKYDLAYNGQESIDLCEVNDYDIILMDLQMPVMDGITASKHIRKHLPQYAKTPIIALTASTLLTKKTLALSAGMSDFVAKPFSPGQLSKVINEHLSGVLTNDDNNVVSTTVETKDEELDREYLDSLYGGDAEYQIDMFEIFLSQVDEDTLALKSAFDSKDYEQVGKIAHKIKPGMAMVGLTDIQTILGALEKSSKEAIEPEIIEHYERFNNTFKSKKVLIQNELSTLKKSFTPR